MYTFSHRYSIKAYFAKLKDLLQKSKELKKIIE